MPRWRPNEGVCNFRFVRLGAVMKPINPVPLIAMLALVVFLYLWINGYLT